jgi:hypothetical protein
MASFGSASDFESDDDLSAEEDVALLGALKSAGFQELMKHSPSSIPVLGGHEENVEFEIHFDAETEVLSVEMGVHLKHQSQAIEHPLGVELRKQKAVFAVKSSVVERVIVSLQQPLRDFFVTYIFNQSVTQISDAFEENDNWEMRLIVLEQAAVLRERLLTALPHDLPDFRLEEKRDRKLETEEGPEKRLTIPRRPTDKEYVEALDCAVIKILLRLFQQSPAAAELLNDVPTEEVQLIPHYHENGSISLSLQVMSMDGNAFDRLLLVSSENFFRIHPSIVASTLNSMDTEEEQKWRKIVADGIFHLLLDLMADGGTDGMTVKMIDNFYRTILKGKLPVILDENFGDIEYQ